MLRRGRLPKALIRETRSREAPLKFVVAELRERPQHSNNLQRSYLFPDIRRWQLPDLE